MPRLFYSAASSSVSLNEEQLDDEKEQVLELPDSERSSNAGSVDEPDLPEEDDDEQVLESIGIETVLWNETSAKYHAAVGLGSIFDGEGEGAARDRLIDSRKLVTTEGLILRAECGRCVSTTSALEAAEGPPRGEGSSACEVCFPSSSDSFGVCKHICGAPLSGRRCCRVRCCSRFLANGRNSECELHACKFHEEEVFRRATTGSSEREALVAGESQAQASGREAQVARGSSREVSASGSSQSSLIEGSSSSSTSPKSSSSKGRSRSKE
jgi:hypothetical protein